MTPLHGKFIVFDGTEGSGKSTQATMLRDRLVSEGADPREILLVRDPGTTHIGEQIRSILLNPDHTEMAMRCEMLLYMAARSQMMAEVIQPALSAGKVVLSDRFVSSTLAYQLGGDGLAAEEIRSVADTAIRGRWPDLTIILDMPVDRSEVRVLPEHLKKQQIPLPFPQQFQPRKVKDRIEQRPREYHERVRQNYLAQAAEDPKGYRVIDADQERVAIHEAVWEAVSHLLLLPLPCTQGRGEG